MEGIPPTVSRIWETLVQGHEPPGDTLRPPESASAGEAAGLRTSSIVFSETLDLSASSPEVRAAARFDLDFEVMRVLGRGGMGVVYAARQAALDREVALKTPLAEAERSPSVEQRFVAEAIVTAGLDHPNVVPVHELGRDEAGNLYMAMKLVRGTAWSDLLHPAAGAPGATLRQHVETLLRVCDAVAYAHSRGVVHRDLKPANVMLGDYGEVLVMDWGLAIAFGEMASKHLAASPRVSAGTPAYMPPEMATGDLDRVGPASDVYLLGAILYEVLTGSPPHRGASVWETLAAAAQGVVEPPETRAPGRMAPRELGRIAQRALAADPTARHGSVRELKDELQLFLAHEESLRLADEAARALERMADVPRAERYARYADLQTSLRQAIRLWPDNEDAQAALALATERYAAEALDRGDLGLAASQADALARLPRRDVARAEQLGLAAAHRQQAAGRSRLVALLVCLALGAALAWVAAWRDADRQRREADDREAELRTAVDRAWTAVREGDVARLTRTLVTVEALRVAPPGRDANTWRADYERRTKWFPWMRQVLVWQQGRWDEVVDIEPPHEHPIADRPSPAETRSALQQILDQELEPASSRPLCDRVLGRPEVAASALGRRLRAPCVGRDLDTTTLWIRLMEHAQNGGDTAAIAAADAEWQAHCAETRDCRETGGVALFRAAVRGTARDAARALPFRLALAPFGPPHTVPAPPQRVLREADGSLLAVDPLSGDRLWRSVPVSKRGPGTLPVADGSVLIADGPRLVRLSAATGHVLARAWLPGDVQAFWPDPRDPARLTVLVGSPDRGELRDVAFDGRTGASPTSWSLAATGVAELGPTYAAAARAHLGLDPRSSSPLPPEGRAFVAERLRAAAERDPADPRAWTAVLEALGPDARANVDLASRAVAAARGEPPRAMTAVGAKLDELGFAAEADTLYEAAARAFQAAHGNADLGFGAFSPGFLMRVSAGRLAARGESARALALVERSRRFGTFVQGDTHFYARYARWLRVQGREEEARAMDARVADSSVVGGASVIPDRFAVGLDVGVLAYATIPPILLVLLLRSWLRSRETRHADLTARGWSTAGQRLVAFLTHPFERAGFTFLAYAPRTERGAIVGLGVVLLYYVCVLVGGIAIYGRLVAEPFDLAHGLTSPDEFLTHVTARVQRAPKPWSLRLLAESHHARGEDAPAAAALKRVLELAPGDALALNNAAVLAEASGRKDDARRGYEAAARASGESAAVARFNLARLAGDRSAQEGARGTLSARDGWAAHDGEPLWALAPARDLLDTMVEERTLAAGARRAFLEIVGTPPVTAIRSAFQIPVAEQLVGWVGVATYVSWFFALLALVWLPLPVRPLAVEASGPPTRVRRVTSRLAQAVGLVLPGSHDLLVGRALVGATLLAAFLFAAAVAWCVYEGGPISGMIGMDAPWERAFFPDLPVGIAFPELHVLGFAAAVFAGLLLALNLVLMVRRVRGRA
jgi:tRNA A-37 threonylcarbamoyl transferase component Bud32